MIPESWSALGTLYSLDVGSNADLCGQLPPGVSPSVVQHGTSTQLSQQCYWQADAQVLLGFKAALADPDADLASWLPGSNPCGLAQWNWLACEQGWPVGLHLQGTRVSGPLSEQVAGLSRLRELTLSSNQLAGTLPPEWGARSNLTVIDLSGNELVGSLPPEWAQLQQLRQLDVSNNQLSGAALPVVVTWSGSPSQALLANASWAEWPRASGRRAKLIMTRRPDIEPARAAQVWHACCSAGGTLLGSCAAAQRSRPIHPGAACAWQPH